jgi:hypothetical protein
MTRRQKRGEKGRRGFFAEKTGAISADRRLGERARGCCLLVLLTLRVHWFALPCLALRFAQRAKTIKTTVKQNIVRSRKELETMIERLKHEITVLKKGGTVA